MKTRVLCVCLLLFAITPFVLSAETGVGAAFFITRDGLGGAALNLSHPKIPGTILGVRGQFGEDTTTIGVYDDWWLYHSKLAGAISLYLGPGFYVNITTSEDSESDFDFGGRLPIGLRFFPIKPIELFIEIAPTLEVFPTLPNFGFQAALGIRFWF